VSLKAPGKGGGIEGAYGKRARLVDESGESKAKSLYNKKRSKKR